MTPISSEWEIEFYTNARGDCPPLDFINGLPKKERAKIYSYIDYLKDVGVLARMPQARHLSGALWELRPSSHRLIYFAHTGHKFIILHAFRKRGRKTNPKHIATAERRMEEFIVRGE